MKLVSSKTMRELDRRAIEGAGIAGADLMDRAGRGVADVVHHLADLAGSDSASVLLIAGPGNNGGDAFAAARHLRELGYHVEVWLAGAESRVQGDALKQLSLLRGESVPVEELAAPEDWAEAMEEPAPAEFIVDGLLGTGSRGPARGPVACAIQFINRMANDAFIVSIDIPSGVNADTGIAEGDAVNADITATLGLPKRGLVEAPALEFVGCLEVVDIGYPRTLIEEAPADPAVELIYSHEMRRLLPRRARISHKGTFGRVLLIGGARGYAGAIALAARAAARSGAGLTTALVPRGIAPVVAGASLETMVAEGAETAEGALSAEAVRAWADRLDGFDAVLAGPGLTRGAEAAAIVHELLARCRVPLVLDADALNVLAGEAGRIGDSRCPVLLTPHPGEMGRLLGADTATVQGDRLASARAAADATGATVVLKGAATVVTARERPAFVNMTGNPGMATGGSGDVLAGLLTGLVGQGIAPFDAAKAAVFLHGRAGDMAAWRGSQTGLVAGDIVLEIPFALREIALR